MRTEMRIERLRPLIIGHAMDNLTGVVEIDIAAWMMTYPELARYTLAVTPPDGTPYFAPAEMEGTILRWIVRREDTAKAGEGSYQIICTGDNGEQKSTDFYPLYIYGNMPGLDGASETPPEAALAWVSKVLDAADRAEEAAERAEGAAAGSVPVATQDKAGVVKPGEGLEVEKDGTLNVVGGGGGAVESVNGKTGAVELGAADVGARPDTWLPTPEEIGAQPAGDYALKNEIPSVPVQSVNGKTGAVQLAAADVGALPADTQIPAPYTLPTASETVKGGVKVGKGLAMEGESLNAEVEKADIDKLSEKIVEQGEAIESKQPKSEYKLIEAFEISEDVSQIVRNREPDGTPYDFTDVYIWFRSPAYTEKRRIYISVGHTAETNIWTNDKIAYFNDASMINTTNVVTECFVSKMKGIYKSEFIGPNIIGSPGAVMGSHPAVNNESIKAVRFFAYSNTTDLIPAGVRIEIWGVRANA